MTSELDLQQIPELRRLLISRLRRFMTPSLHRFATSWLYRFKIPDPHKFTTPSFACPGLQIFTSSRFWSFTSLRFQILAGSRFLSFAGPGLQISTSSRLRRFAGSRLMKTYFTNFIKLGVSRVMGFPEFPNSDGGTRARETSWVSGAGGRRRGGGPTERCGRSLVRRRMTGEAGRWRTGENGGERARAASG
jgi:hypothetical protein